MANALEQLADKTFTNMHIWCESKAFATSFVMAIAKSDIPVEERSPLIEDAVLIGDAAYHANHIDSGRPCDGLRLSSLAQPGKYSDQTIRIVLGLMREHLDDRFGYMRDYITEFNTLLETSHRAAIAA